MHEVVCAEDVWIIDQDHCNAPLAIILSKLAKCEFFKSSCLRRCGLASIVPNLNRAVPCLCVAGQYTPRKLHAAIQSQISKDHTISAIPGANVAAIAEPLS